MWTRMKVRFEKFFTKNLYEKDFTRQCHAHRIGLEGLRFDNDCPLPRLAIKYVSLPQKRPVNATRIVSSIWWLIEITCDWRELLTIFFAQDSLFNSLLQDRHRRVQELHSKIARQIAANPSQDGISIDKFISGLQRTYVESTKDLAREALKKRLKKELDQKKQGDCVESSNSRFKRSA